MHTIHVPRRFRHVGDLPSRDAAADPRLTTFPDGPIEIDMRQCEFILPAAVLWCAVYPILSQSQGRMTRLLVPENMGVCVYLQTVGLFSTLKQAGVEVDDRSIFPQADSQVVLPLTRFLTTNDVEIIANQSLATLNDSGLSSANLNAVVSEVFAELGLNAAQHARSPVGSFGLIQFYQGLQGKRFICVVADGGIGIRRSLEQNPELKERVPYDWVAIELALRERISGTGDATRGIGLYGVSEDMRKPGRQLIINSGIGMLVTSEQIESRTQRTALFPGTLAYASISA